MSMIDWKSSGATAIVSGIVSRMRNTCPKSSPDEIRDALMTTATKYTGFYHQKVLGGYVNPKAALDKLKTSLSCVDIPPGTLWRYGTSYSANDDANHIQESAFIAACKTGNTIVPDGEFITCVTTDSAYGKVGDLFRVDICRARIGSIEYWKGLPCDIYN